MTHLVLLLIGAAVVLTFTMIYLIAEFFPRRR